MKRRPAVELADVMRAFSGAYVKAYGERMPAVHRKAIRDITACRTPAMGGTSWWCPACHLFQYSYHSCGNRNCNKCGNERAQQWLGQTGRLLLPIGHFMVTFTLPGELRRLARSHQKLFYGLLMRCAAEALQTLGYDSRYVGGRLAMMGVLHTWARNLSYHPHVHMIVAGGGLWEAEDLWLPSHGDFLMPVKALSKIFAAKFRDALTKTAPDIFADIDPSVWLGSWVVHIQGIGQGEGALKYLAQYIFRPAISNKRILSMSDGRVSFRYQNSQTNQWKTASLEAVEFIRRYLQHVLPRGFVKVRYYGLYAHRSRDKLDRLRNQLAGTDSESNRTDAGETPQPDSDTRQETPLSTHACPGCGQPMRLAGQMPRVGFWPHAPPNGYRPAVNI